jgi:dTDP-4-amino-4,6-dideoxygalactose transaminase
MLNKFDTEIIEMKKLFKKGIFGLSGYMGNYSAGFQGGENIKELEKKISDKFNSNYAICCNSATSALLIALVATCEFNFEKEHREVIVTPYSMTCSASIPIWAGYTPVFADIEEDYFCLSADDIEKKITKHTKAIIVVDLFGHTYDVERINKIAKENNIVVIEDAAQAIGAKYKNKFAGTLGDVGILSFNTHKHITTGEGGVILTDNSETAFKARLVMNHAEAVVNDMQSQGFSIKGYERALGLNLRMTEMQAVVAIEQLKKLDKILETYRGNAKYFPIKHRDDVLHSYYRYAFTDTEKIDKNTPYDDFHFKTGYINPVYNMPLFQSLGYEKKQCKNAEHINKNIMLVWNQGCG